MSKQGWEIKFLKEISNCLIGITYKPENVTEEGIIVLRSGNIKDNQIVFDDILRVNKNIAEKFFLKKNDILMCSRNGSHRLVGKCTLIKNLPEEMTFGAFMTVIRSQYKDFLYYFFKSSRFRDQLTTSKTSTINQITISMLNELRVPVPPLPIQNQIVKELDTLQAIITKKKTQLDELDKLAQATFYDMFGDPVENERSWTIKAIDEVSNLKAGTFVKASNISNKSQPELYACYGANGLRGYVSTYTHEGIHILIGRQGALCGNVTLASGKFHATEHAIVLTHKLKINNLWFLYTLDYLNLNQFATGAAQPGLSVNKILKLKVPFPPLPLQNQFAERIKAIEQQKALINQSIAETQLLFDSAMDNYFN